MSFDKDQFNQTMDKSDTMIRFNEEGALDSLKNQILNMTPAEKNVAIKMMNNHNQDHATKLSVEGNILGDFEIVGTQKVKPLGVVLGSVVIKHSSH